MCPGREGTAILTLHTESGAQRGAIISDDHTGHHVSLEPKAQLQSDRSHDWNSQPREVDGLMSAKIYI